MGRTFKAPKRGDLEQWLKVQSLYAYGFRFFSYHNTPDTPPLPERLREVKEFVRANPSHPLRVSEAKPELMMRGAGCFRGD